MTSIAASTSAVACVLALMVMATCTPSRVVDYCAEWCDCEGCNDDDQKSCEIWTDAVLEIADEYGCEPEAADAIDCLTREGRCVANQYTDQGGECDNEQSDAGECIADHSDYPPFEILN